MFKKLSDFTNFKKGLNEKNIKDLQNPQPLIAPSEPKIAEPATKPSINPFKPGKRDPKESPKPKAFKLISDVLKEAMSHKRHPDVEKSLKSKTHSLAKNAAYPDEDFDNIIADERFKEIIDKLQSYVHDKHTDVENMRDLQMLLMKVYNEVIEIEADHIEELEKLAIDLICKEFNISEDDVDFEAKMIKHGEISLSDIDDEDVADIADDLTGLELEVEKRKFINSLIHGSAVKATYAYHLISDGLKKIHPGLVDMYSILSVMSEYGYWVVPDNIGGEEASVGKMKLDLQDDTPKIIVQATSFPFLIHELAKGVTELLMSHDSLTSIEREKVIKAADSLASERMALRLGPGFWQRLNNAIYDSRNEEYKNNIIAVLSSKPAAEFNAIMKNILSGDKNATKEINGIVKDIKHDISKHKLGENMITNMNEWKNSHLNENKKQAEAYIKAGKISQKTVDSIIAIDPSKTKKYVGWLSKMYIEDAYEIDSMKSYVEEYDLLVGKSKAEKNDIGGFKTLDEFKSYIDELNSRGTASMKELEDDYEVIKDDKDLYIANPNTHEASRKLGLTVFAHRNNDCDSAWCTTYKNNSHFNDYFFKKDVTFYYVLVRNEKMKEELDKLSGDNKNWYKLAFAIHDDSSIELYDAMDVQIKSKVSNIKKILGI